MLELYKQAAEYIAAKSNLKPQIGIILGTGLSPIADAMQVDIAIPYADIPGFPTSTVKGHDGKLIFGKLNNTPVLVMKGRFHYYEGYDMQTVTFPVRVMKLLGIESLVVSNASGGLDDNHEIGDLMVIDDHINLFPTNPLIGPNLEEFGPRFPDMSEAYYKPYIDKAFEIAYELDLRLHKGTYAGLTGPTFETPAEYKMIRIIGAQAVGMSTVPEVIVARHAGIKVFGISIITDIGIEGKIVEVSHDEVLENAKKNEKKLVELVARLVASMH